MGRVFVVIPFSRCGSSSLKPSISEGKYQFPTQDNSRGVTNTGSRREMAFILIGRGYVDDTCSVSTGRLNIGSLGKRKNRCKMGLAKSSTTSDEAPRHS